MTRISIVLLLGTFTVAVHSHIYSASLHSGYDGDGSAIYSNKGCENFPYFEYFDNKARSICLVGTWIIYSDPNYNPSGYGNIAGFFRSRQECINLTGKYANLANDVSSMRSAGSCLSFEEETLTLYEHVNFQGQDLINLGETQDTRELATHKSLIITGPKEWTVYDQPHFKGSSMCIKRDILEVPLFISDLQQANPQIPYGSIRSARLGCKSQNILTFNSTIESSAFVFSNILPQ